MTFPRFYIDRRGHCYSVEKAKKGPGWCSYRYGGNHSSRRLRRRALPVRGSEDEARRDLAAYAKRKSWKGIGVW